jgi:site-specific recombinase XerD
MLENPQAAAGHGDLADAPAPNKDGGTRMDTTRLIDLYVISRKARGAPKGSLDNIRWSLDHFSHFIGSRPVDKIGSGDLERWLDSIGSYAPSSQRAMISNVRGFLAWCVRRKYVRRNVGYDIRGPREPRRNPRALLGDAACRIVAACPDARARFIVVTMLQQGTRCVEISRLQVGDVDRFHGTMHLIGKAQHERILPMMDETALALHEYLMEHPANAGPLVRSYTRPRQPLTPGSISRLVSQIMYDAGVKLAPGDGISAHANRHTALTDMLLSGAHLKDVQAAAGHQHLSSTERYLPYVVHGLESAMSGRSYRYGGNRHP